MAETFAAAAARLAGLVPRALGWRPDHFWSATPEELAAIFTADPAADADTPLGRSELEHMLERERDGR